MKPLVQTFLLIALAAASEARARDLYVGGVGENRFPTIQAAINAAKPGDTIHLNPADSPYREMAVFNNVSGMSDQPIVLDGHGAVLLGCDPIVPAQWADQGDGLWRSSALAERLKANSNLVSRFFFVFENRPQYMGGAFKHRPPTLKAPAELNVHEWTYVESDKAFYIRIPAGIPLEDAEIEVPVRSAGVAMRGNSSNIIVRNVKASRVWNDGFNIHGQCTNILFADIEAIECGDDGISAHGQCEITVAGMISRGNANGICHVDQSRTVSHDVHIAESRAYDLYLLHESQHEFHNVTIQPSGPRGIVFTSGVEATFHGSMIGTDEIASRILIRNGARVAFMNSQLRSTDIGVRDAIAELNRTTITGKHAGLTVSRVRGWLMQDCIWEGSRLVHEGQKFEPGDLTGFNQSIEAGLSQRTSE